MTTHIAGFVVSINQRVIQRCAVCGLVLIDTKGQVRQEGQEVAVWAVNSLVREIPHPSGRHWGLLPPTNPPTLPADCCIDLV